MLTWWQWLLLQAYTAFMGVAFWNYWSQEKPGQAFFHLALVFLAPLLWRMIFAWKRA